MKSSIGRLTAGIGYGFLFGAGAGLTAGVVTDRLFFWTIIGVIAGIVIGCAVALIVAARSRRMKSRFGQPDQARDDGPA
jgi:F0F1-type ATP synthase assembly protein I